MKELGGSRRPGYRRVLFMSGFAEPDLFDRAAIDRAAPFLEKPFTVESLMARVRSVLDV